MRVALTASLVAPILPAEANGPHSVIVDLARGLQGRGHDVAIYAAAGSVVRGVPLVEIDVESVAAQAALRADGVVNGVAREALRRGFEQQFAAIRDRGADIVSQHAFDAPPFELTRGMRVVHTLHLPPVDPDVVRAARYTTQPIVTVSRAAARAWLGAGVHGLTVIRNGVPQPARIAQPEPNGPPFALIAGRVSPEKGTHIAIRAARAAGLPSRVVGDIYDRDYFEREVAPLLASGEEIHPVARQEVAGLMAEAAQTLMPVRWEETFGLVAAEAQMNGCPVVGFRRGALPEIVTDGIGGFLVEPDDEEALGAAIAPAMTLDRNAIAASARRTLGIEPMIDAYENLFVDVIGRAAAA
jgi:glycosyltransferase involved in cell wall biosynthesis